VGSTGGGAFFLRGGACGLWHFGQKKNPARIATMVRHTRTTMAVMAAGPTGFGVSGMPVVVAGRLFVDLQVRGFNRVFSSIFIRFELASSVQFQPFKPQNAEVELFRRDNTFVEHDDVYRNTCNPDGEQSSPKEPLVFNCAWSWVQLFIGMFW
jgi:hypothetical protein